MATDDTKVIESPTSILRNGASVKREPRPHVCDGSPSCPHHVWEDNQPDWAKGEHVSIPLNELAQCDSETLMLLDAETLFRLYGK